MLTHSHSATSLYNFNYISQSAISFHRAPHTCERARWRADGLVFSRVRHFGLLSYFLSSFYSRSYRLPIKMETLYPHLVSSQSLRRSKQSLRRSKQSLRRSKKQSLRRSKQSLRRPNKSLRRPNESLRRPNESLRRQNESLRRSEQALLKRLKAIWKVHGL